MVDASFFSEARQDSGGQHWALVDAADGGDLGAERLLQLSPGERRKILGQDPEPEPEAY